MTTVYGAPAVEVAQPDGEVVPYLCAAVPAPPGSWRAWRVTGPDGQTYVVSESPAGKWACTCPHWKFRGRFKCLPGGEVDDKHVSAVRRELEATDAGDQAKVGGRPGERPPGTLGSGELPPHQ